MAPFSDGVYSPVVPHTPKFEMPVGPGAIVPSVTSGLEAIVRTPVAAGTGMTLALTVDGRAYVFKSCAGATLGGGKRGIVGDIKKARAVEGEIVGLVVDVVPVNEFMRARCQVPEQRPISCTKAVRCSYLLACHVRRCGHDNGLHSGGRVGFET